MSERKCGPMLTSDLEERDTVIDADHIGWHAAALRTLAGQLGFANDYYFPLLGAAQLLDGKTSRQAKREYQPRKQE